MYFKYNLTLIAAMIDDCKNIVLQINMKKSKVLVLEKKVTRTDIGVVVDDIVLKQVYQFV